MSYTYPHWYSQKGGEISMAPFEDQEDVHNKTSSPGCEKTCAKPLVSAAWVKQLNSYSGSLLSLLSFYFYKSLPQDGRYSNVWL